MLTNHSAKLKQAIFTTYEQRTPIQHRLLVDLLSNYFSTLTYKHHLMLSFFLEGLCGPQTISRETHHPHSYIILLPTSQNPQAKPVIRQLKEEEVQVEQGETAAVLEYHKYGDTLALGETTPEDEMAFWQSSEFLCSVPRKRLIQLTRTGKVISYHQGQQPFTQGQLMTQSESGSGVYVVRKGEFSFYHRNKSEVETCRFGQGHIFGSLELLHQCKQRVMTVRCKTKVGVVYRFSEEEFEKYIKNYCIGPIRAKEGKLTKFLPQSSLSQQTQHSQPLLHPLRTKAISSTEFFRNSFKEQQLSEKQDFTQKKAFPAINLERIRNSTSLTFYSCKKESQRIEEQGVQKWGDYLKICREGPLKRYPLAAQRSQFRTSEFNEVKRLMGQRQGQKECPVWKRDMLTSFYRQSLYDDFKRRCK